jgi:hypothetical protein
MGKMEKEKKMEIFADTSAFKGEKHENKQNYNC